MPIITANGVDLYHEIAGDGPLLVLVHGSWSDHTSWQLTMPMLAEEFRVLSYDRRGHSRSERPPGPRTRRQDEDDLAALIETLGTGPAHLVASSFGGLIALGLAARRADLVHTVAVHEPPALSLFTGGRRARLAGVLQATLNRVLADVDAGAVEDGARRFTEIALGPGSWDMLPEPMRAIFLANGPAFAAEQRDPECLTVDTVGLDRLAGRVLLSKGDAAPEWLQIVIDSLSELLPAAQVATIAGAGHVPHVTHPIEHAALVKSFVSAQSTAASV
jgi:pimeloyl-ACP methyl ester carboxylesterase